MSDFDVIILGGGPAGLSAALMLGRARRRVLVVDGGEPRNRCADHVHGVLGREGVRPTDFLASARQEVAAYGIEHSAGEATEVVDEGDRVRVLLADGRAVTARALVVTTGMVDELPDIPGLAERWGRGVVHCPYCHGYEVADRRLGVVTTSPLSLHQAQLVRQWSDDVTVFTAGLGRLDMATEFRLRSRGVRLVAPQVVAIGGAGSSVEWVETASGDRFEIDAVFVAPTPRPRDGFLRRLALDCTETPFGRFLAVDATGRTSSPRIWAAGNVVDPGATVSVSIGAGALVGGAVNGTLVTEDFDSAVRARESWPDVAPLDYWEHRYAGPRATWSGRVNVVLETVARDLTPGRALDLGCGEGADVVWLAANGWTVTGIDISRSAIARAKSAAVDAGVEENVHLRVGDLSVLDETSEFDLVTASFLHSPVDLPREQILRRAALSVAPGGRLLITSHVAMPHGNEVLPAPEFVTPAQEVARLQLDTSDWEVEIVEVRTRFSGEEHRHASDRGDSPEGSESREPAHAEDSVVLLRRIR